MTRVLILALIALSLSGCGIVDFYCLTDRTPYSPAWCRAL